MFSKVKIQPVAKYDWEHKYYYGRLIAVSNSFLAYAIRGEFSSTCVDSCVQKNRKCFCDCRSTFSAQHDLFQWLSAVFRLVCEPIK